MKELCGRLALEGFIAFAPDLYHGQIAATIEEAQILSGRLKGEQARADIAEAVAFVSQRAEVGGSGLGVIGFSLGAYYALGLSVDDPERVGRGRGLLRNERWRLQAIEGSLSRPLCPNR